jgi:protein SCO1/2
LKVITSSERYSAEHCNMNKFRKAGLLITTLVIPALIFTFLKFFASNHYNLPYYHALHDDQGNVLMTGGDTVFYKAEIKGVKPVGGGVLSSDVLLGKVTVVSVFPPVYDNATALQYAQLGRVFALRQTIPYLQLITAAESWPIAEEGLPEAMGGADWKVLTFSDSTGRAEFYQSVKLETAVPGVKNDRIVHRLVLIDQRGYIRGYFNGADVEEIERLMAEIKILDYEKRDE